MRKIGRCIDGIAGWISNELRCERKEKRVKASGNDESIEHTMALLLYLLLNLHWICCRLDKKECNKSKEVGTCCGGKIF